MNPIKYRTKTWVQNTPGKIERASENNLISCFFVFRNTGNQPLNIGTRLLNVGDEFDTRTPFFAIDDTSYELNFGTNTQSNCEDKDVAEVTVTRYDLIR